MASPNQYTPPSSSEMLRRQNSQDSLRLLIAQRRLHTRAKRWAGLRWLGMAVIAVAAPVVAVVWPQTAVAVGAIAGIWIFLGRTLLELAQTSATTKAASVQEQFDFGVFGMPSPASRSTLPSLEDVSRIAGDNATLQATARREKLTDWYPIDAGDVGALSVAISQRANASYSDGLLRTTAIVWAVVTGLWIVALVVATLIVGLELSTFLLGIAFPVMPALLDVFQYIRGVWQSAQDRADLASAIEMEISASSLSPDDLLVWQERLFELRRSAPQVPDVIYKIRRRKQEGAMQTAARLLSQRGRGQTP